MQFYYYLFFLKKVKQVNKNKKGKNCTQRRKSKQLFCQAWEYLTKIVPKIRLRWSELFITSPESVVYFYVFNESLCVKLGTQSLTYDSSLIGFAGNLPSLLNSTNYGPYQMILQV